MSSVGSFLSMSITLYVPSLSIASLKVLMIAFGFFSSMFLPSFTLMRLIHTKENAGAALGFMNAANMLGGAFGQPLIGALLERSRLHELAAKGAMTVATDGERIYSAANYQFALTTLPVIIGMSFFLLPFIKELKPH